MKIRAATIADASAIHSLIAQYAAKDLLLPRTREDVAREIETFVVCEDSRVVVGCLSLAEYRSDLAEIRSVAVAPEKASQGIGSKLVQRALHDAQSRGISRVLAVTGTPQFFSRLGFAAAEPDVMSAKVERDCIGCSKARACRLVPMIAELHPHSAILPIITSIRSPLATEC
jgi:amino-acid N-acetyltransferase